MHLLVQRINGRLISGIGKCSIISAILWLIDSRLDLQYDATSVC